MRAQAEQDQQGWMTTLGAACSVLVGCTKREIKKALQPQANIDAKIAQAVSQLNREGFAVLPGYYTAEQCAQGRAEIDAMIYDRPAAIQSFGEGSDLRVYGAEHASSIASGFHRDAFLGDTGRVYGRGSIVNFSTLAARLTAKSGNLGSGQGWHRDAFHFQYKSLIYLSDVGMDNGPFQIFPGSHHALDVVRDTLVGRLQGPPSTRISERQIERLLAADPNRAKPLPGTAGTLVLFDSSTIHRGMPIRTGTRYALTNYFYPPHALSPEFRRSFEPLITA